MSAARRISPDQRVEMTSAERMAAVRALCARAEARMAGGAQAAKRLALQALYTAEADAAVAPATVAEVLLELGPIREALGEIDAAEMTYRRALALLDTAEDPPQDVDRLRSAALARLAHVYCAQGRYDDAEAITARAWRR